MSVINQKEYLKKYLGIGKNPGEKKKKKKKIVSKTVHIIDDDIDLHSNDIQEDLKGPDEDAPQIVAIIDERPPSLRVDEKHNKLWQLIGETASTSAASSGISIKLEVGEKTIPKSNALKKKSSETTSLKKIKVEKLSPPHNDDNTPPRRRIKDEDFSPPRRIKSESNGDNSPTRRPKVERSPRRRNSDSSPPRRVKNEDCSLPRKHIKVENSSPPRRNIKNEDSSPPRRTNSDLSPPRRRHNDVGHIKTEDSSPPRRTNSDLSPPRRRHNDVSPPRRHVKTEDSSPPRRKIKTEDLSPPRRRTEHSSRNQDEPSTSKIDSDSSPPRRHRSDSSPPRRRKPDSSPRRHRPDSSPRRNKPDSSPPRKRRFKEQGRSRFGDASPPRRDDSPPKKKMSETLDGKRAGLQNAAELAKETMALKQREDEMFKKMSADVSGRNAETVVRNKKPVDPEEEMRKMEKEREMKEKYSKWGRGLKQVEDMNERMSQELYEMSKPLARYRDDEDLERYLKEQEREGDPMLAYIRKKKKKEAVDAGVPEKPMYQGEFMPNRFGIRPGYRWDGVDRSNGYEKKWFTVQNTKKAELEESYKWSTEDM